MSKKDFELIARVLKSAQRDLNDGGTYTRTSTSDAAHLARTVARFADELASTSPRFDRERFLNAAGA